MSKEFVPDNISHSVAFILFYIRTSRTQNLFPNRSFFYSQLAPVKLSANNEIMGMIYIHLQMSLYLDVSNVWYKSHTVWGSFYSGSRKRWEENLTLLFLAIFVDIWKRGHYISSHAIYFGKKLRKGHWAKISKETNCAQMNEH